MAVIDSLMAECCSDIAALQAEMAALLSTESGSMSAADARRRGMGASAAALAAQALRATLPAKCLRHATAPQASAAALADTRRHETAASAAASVAAAASIPSLHPFEALMAVLKMLDGGGAHPFCGGPLHPPQMRARGRRLCRRVCR